MFKKQEDTEKLLGNESSIYGSTNDGNCYSKGDCKVIVNPSLNVQDNDPVHTEISITKDEHEVNGKTPNEEAIKEEKPKKKFGRRQIFILCVLIYGNFWLAACYSVIAPFFPKEANKKGVSASVYGLIFGVYSLTMFVFSPVMAKLVPKLSPRFMVSSGSFFTGSCSILFGTLNMSPPKTTFAALAFLVRIFEAIGVSAYFTAAYSSVAVAFPDNRATVMSLMESAFGLGMIAGPMLGGVLYQLGGYMLPFAVLGAISLMTSVLAYVALPSEEGKSEDNRASMWTVLKYPRFTIDVTVFFAASLFIGFNDATLEPHLRDFNLKPIVVGSVFMVLGGIYAVTTPFWGVIIDKMNDARILNVFGCIVCVPCYLIIGPAPFFDFGTKLWLVILAQALMGIGFGAMMVTSFLDALKSAVIIGFPDDIATYAMVGGVATGLSSLGSFIGPSLGGFLLDHVGYRKASMVMLAIAFLLAFVQMSNQIIERYYKKRDAERDKEERSSDTISPS